MSDTEQLRKDLHRLIDKVKAHGVLSRVWKILLREYNRQ